MHWLRLLFGFGGRIGRVPFLAGLIAVGIAFVIGIEAAEAALPWMARVLAPRGINAGLALNVIWSLVWLLAVWAALALSIKRLLTCGMSGWWAAAAILPPVALAQLNDAIFLVSRSVTLPAVVQYAILAASGAVALWVLYETVMRGENPTV